MAVGAHSPCTWPQQPLTWDLDSLLSLSHQTLDLSPEECGQESDSSRTLALDDSDKRGHLWSLPQLTAVKSEVRDPRLPSDSRVGAVEGASHSVGAVSSEETVLYPALLRVSGQGTRKLQRTSGM